ncbi:MAG: molybdenum cofactor guanylyltransferase MobA [Lysobacteraceae bacterium]|nr:MAG: molybdenum cofactor guanylyltransferase MobA [Xanthomonadaceae bacterium]
MPSAHARPSRDTITGLVLAGGRGSRMGGIDKGLIDFDGAPLALRALQRLQPQVGRAALSANRHLDRYREFGVPVWPDTLADFPGPLAGVLAGLTHCETSWLVTVACDTPRFPADLVARLAWAATHQPADIVMAASIGSAGLAQPEPAFCLLRCGLAEDLQAFLIEGGRRIQDWTERHRTVRAVFDQPFDDPLAFTNANTREELAALEKKAA